MSAKSLMVMGTASDAGKSVLVTALCRAFLRAGIRVAPFKAQNMSNNAAVCAGGEIGRAQAAQAEACGLEPTVDMNPVLLKPDSEMGCQVVIGGRARFHMTAMEHDRYREQAWPEIVAGYQRLARNFDLIVIEGAGGAAEINLRHRDLVNWAVAEMTGAPVLIVGDIDKGGVFASLFGTVELLSPPDRARVKGLIINKFRGDPRLLQDGLRMLEERTGIPVLGVLPYIHGLRIPQEDGAVLDGTPARAHHAAARDLAAGVVRLPRISNYTDFAPIDDEPDVAVHYLTDPADAPDLDILLLPGTKNTVADLRWLRQAGWENYLARHLRRGGWVVGVCGGYQMLGRRILDPDGVESKIAAVTGLGLLDVETTFAPNKVTARVNASHVASGHAVAGYEIHAGRVTREDGARALLRITAREGAAVDELEGAQSDDGRVLGTSVHGLFDSAGFRRSFLDSVRAAKGLAPHADGTGEDFKAVRERAYDLMAEVAAAQLDLRRLLALAGIT
ncbi:MAG TPA: cobyric acid synthase [Candidatus Binataceae bacterium]|nr:cobyric acid synthase [Candidatus Binataceae bacterium]